MQQNLTLKEALEQLETAVKGVSLHFNDADKMQLQDLLNSFKLLKEGKDTLDELQEIVSAVYQKLSYETIPTMFENMDMDSIKLSGRNFILSSRLNASIPLENKEKGFAWLKEHKLDSLIQPNVNSKSLSSAIKLYFEGSAIMPPQDAIKTHLQKYISIRKV